MTELLAIESHVCVCACITQTNLCTLLEVLKGQLPRQYDLGGGIFVQIEGLTLHGLALLIGGANLVKKYFKGILLGLVAE